MDNGKTSVIDGQYLESDSKSGSKFASTTYK
jgi:hypothetical protein